MKKNIGADLGAIVFGSCEKADLSAAKSKMITRNEALSVGKLFAEQIREQVDSEALIFVFGSAVKGTAHLGSDIDIAVVSKIFDGDFIREAGRVSSLAQSVCDEIEIHALAPFDWRMGDPHILEIQKWGIKI